MSNVTVETYVKINGETNAARLLNEAWHSFAVISFLHTAEVFVTTATSRCTEGAYAIKMVKYTPL